MTNNNRIALGTVQFGIDYGISNKNGQVNLIQAKEILDLAKKSGITTLDTAVAYGQSEAVLGKIGVQDCEIVSKLPAIPSGVEDVSNWVAQEIANSLERLKIPRLNSLLLHRPEQLFGSQGKALYSSLLAQKNMGLVQKIGVSIYSPDQLPEIVNEFEIDLVQAPLNILDQSIVRSGWSKKLINMGIELHARSIFLQGLLLMGNNRPNKFSRWKPLWDQWDVWLDDNSISSLEACLRYVMSISEVSKVVVGVESRNQLLEIIAASNGLCPSPPNWNMPIEASLANPANWNQL